MFLRHRRPLTATLLAAALVLTACGSDGPAAEGIAPVADTATSVAATDADAAAGDAGADTPTATDVEDTTVESAAGESEVDEPAVALRVVSLSPTHTEMMFAIGAGDLLVAVDELSNHPAEALAVPNDLSGFEPNVEAIAAYAPDLVLIGGDFTGLGDQLAAIGVDSWDGPAAAHLGEVYDQIEQLGAATGRVEAAAALIADMQDDIAAVVDSVEPRLDPLTYFYELDPSLFSVNSTTFVGELFTLLGLRNIADQVEGDTGGYPQLNAEFIVAEDPDMIFLADTKCCGESAATVAARPGWDAVTAVRTGAVVELDDDIASRWGPRVVDLVRTIATAVDSVPVER